MKLFCRASNDLTSGCQVQCVGSKQASYSHICIGQLTQVGHSNIHQCPSDVNVYVSQLGSLLKCRLCLLSGDGPRILHFLQAPRWYLCCYLWTTLLDLLPDSKFCSIYSSLIMWKGYTQCSQTANIEVYCVRKVCDCEALGVSKNIS